jgi:hypothetical protein
LEISLAAVCCDQTFGKDEARVIREQLLGRNAYRELERQPRSGQI